MRGQHQGSRWARFLYAIGSLICAFPSAASGAPPASTAVLPPQVYPSTNLPPVDSLSLSADDTDPFDVDLVSVPDAAGVPQTIVAPETIAVPAPPHRGSTPPSTAPSASSWYTPAYWFGPTPWERSIELGINGASGTNESLSVRAGGYLKRKTDWNKVDVQFVYNQTRSRSVQSQNNAQLDARHDWLLGESPWTLFLASSLLYDEFQAFDTRLALNGGLGYQLLDSKNQSLIGRIGAGSSREFGGPDNRWVPEALFGAEYNLNISDSQKLYAKADYYPDWENFATSYRVVTDVGWEIEVDAETNMSLKISVNDRYDSTPNGANPNLLNYSVLVLWRL